MITVLNDKIYDLGHGKSNLTATNATDYDYDNADENMVMEISKTAVVTASGCHESNEHLMFDRIKIQESIAGCFTCDEVVHGNHLNNKCCVNTQRSSRPNWGHHRTFVVFWSHQTSLFSILYATER